ncbi:MAG: NAD-dependent epimerase/dehydratase family protein [Oscillibacter sp.]|nr:NAD-dependent epimerase/dehydratase family protein [Oscillibacter sp.]
MDMMKDPGYRNALERLRAAFPFWEELEGKALFLSGASGMLGSLLTDAVMCGNEALPPERRCRILAASRNRAAAAARFAYWRNCPELMLLELDVAQPLPTLPVEPDFWIHAASTTHPAAYASAPVETVLTNVLGSRNLMERAGTARLLLVSSVEIYGENRGGERYFREDSCGYLDCNTLRAGYPEAKRASEALCQAYIEERGLDGVIIRLPRCYGPTMRWSDTKASSQFIKKAVLGEPIVLKSQGTQTFSYAHAADAVRGILWVLLRGRRGEAYNLADSRSDVSLRTLAETAASCAGTEVVFDLPDQLEAKGYSTATLALLDAARLRALGWTAEYDTGTGIRETVDILRRLHGSGGT